MQVNPGQRVGAVAFDMGGVLTHTAFGGLEEYALSLGLPADMLVGYFRGHAQMALLETAQITSREFFKFVCVDAERAAGCGWTFTGSPRRPPAARS